jgi:hypothetical protein
MEGLDELTEVQLRDLQEQLGQFMYAFHCFLRLLGGYPQQLEHHRIRIPVELDTRLPPCHNSLVLILPLSLGSADDLDEVPAGEVHLGVELLVTIEVFEVDPGLLPVLGTQAFLDLLLAEGLIEGHLAEDGVALQVGRYFLPR